MAVLQAAKSDWSEHVFREARARFLHDALTTQTFCHGFQIRKTVSHVLLQEGRYHDAVRSRTEPYGLERIRRSTFKR